RRHTRSTRDWSSDVCSSDLNAYTEVLHTLLTRRILVPLAAVVVLGVGGTLFFFVGRDFFPIVDGGQIQLHVRAPAGTRIEKTERSEERRVGKEREERREARG